MKTVTFYSYKGGVGRTLALANIALRLSEFGKKVCILDFDLEAPGVHYKFPKVDLHNRKGLVDYIYEYVQTKERPENYPISTGQSYFIKKMESYFYWI